MSTEIIKEVNIDLYERKRILINAKQYDNLSRFVMFTCYNQGNIFVLNSNEHLVYIRYRKPDGYGIFNSCEITNDGKIKVELTEQMLSKVGNCIADLVILDGYEGDIPEISSDGQLQIDDSTIISSMDFSVNVIQNPFGDVEIEPSPLPDASNIGF